MVVTIEITENLAIDQDEIEERFVRASGPGGQHVNKTSTAVELRFDIRNSPSLPDDIKLRLERLAGSRLTQDGVIVLFAQAARSQEFNRRAARARLLALIARAAEKPKPRKATRPTYASTLRRREAKSRRAAIKTARGTPRTDD